MHLNIKIVFAEEQNSQLLPLLLNTLVVIHSTGRQRPTTLKCVTRYAKYFKEIEMRSPSQIYIPSRRRRRRWRRRQGKIYDVGRLEWYVALGSSFGGVASSRPRRRPSWQCRESLGWCRAGGIGRDNWVTIQYSGRVSGHFWRRFSDHPFP